MAPLHQPSLTSLLPPEKSSSYQHPFNHPLAAAEPLMEPMNAFMKRNARQNGSLKDTQKAENLTPKTRGELFAELDFNYGTNTSKCLCRQEANVWATVLSAGKNVMLFSQFFCTWGGWGAEGCPHVPSGHILNPAHPLPKTQRKV